MSAYVVSPDTIDYLASAAERFGVDFYSPLPYEAGPEAIAAATIDETSNRGLFFRFSARTQANTLAKILHAANVRSVAYRYDNAADMLPSYVYEFDRVSDIDPVVALGSVRCLRYQSCECPDYAKTAGAALLDAIEHELIRQITKDVPWGWTREHEAERRAAAKPANRAQYAAGVH